MNIVNKQKEVLFDFQEYENLYLDADYAIYSIDINGCRIDQVTSGKLTSDLLSLSLPDGNYEITVKKDNYADLNENFVVYYNYLFIFICEFKKLICSENCNDCNSDIDNKLNEFLYRSLVHFNCLDLFSNMPFTRKTLCKQSKILDSKTEYEIYYGKFNFDYEKNIKNLLISIYLELYCNTINKLRQDDVELEGINSFFQIESIKRCLYNQGIDIEDIKYEINNLNYNCNELPEPTTYTLTVNPTPANAVVTLNGQATNTLTVNAGTVINMVVSKAGYITQSEAITMNSNQTRNIILLQDLTLSFQYYWGEIGNIFAANPSSISEANWDTQIKPNGTNGGMSYFPNASSFPADMHKIATGLNYQWWIVLVPANQSATVADLVNYNWFIWDELLQAWVDYPAGGIQNQGNVTLDGILWKYTAVRPTTITKVKFSKTQISGQP